MSFKLKECESCHRQKLCNGRWCAACKKVPIQEAIPSGITITFDKNQMRKMIKAFGKEEVIRKITNTNTMLQESYVRKIVDEFCI